MQCFGSENVLMEFKRVCLKINGKQRVKLRNGSVKLKNHSNQLAMSFRIYADFESILKGVWNDDRGSNGS